MRVATAGIGLRAGHVLSILKQNMPEIEFVGYVDPQSSYLDMIGQHVPQFDTVEDMLAKTKPDLYFIGSPNSFHLDHIRAGLEANVQNIFTEKPVVTSISETMQLTKLLAKHGGGSRLMVTPSCPLSSCFRLAILIIYEQHHSGFPGFFVILNL